MSLIEDTKDLSPKPVSPATLVGVASPLWGLYAGAAATGIAWWWMTRWTRPQNLEAMWGALTPAIDTAQEGVAEALLESDLPTFVVGGEASPIGVVTEAAMAAETAPEPVAEAAAEPEPLVEASPEPEAAPKPKAHAEPRSVAPKSRPAAQPKTD